MNIRPTLLVILDGWGLAEPWGGNAITCAHTPAFNTIYKNFPRTRLHASGTLVGLPGNEMGNSEVGHLNIGAGKIIKQDVTMINESIANGSFYKNQKILSAIKSAKESKTTVHLLGLVSSGGVHSSINHLFALIKMCNDNGLKDFKIHAITDGRDSDTLSVIEFLTKLEYLLRELGSGKVVSIIGRYFAMDRDNRWDRIEKAYNLMTQGAGNYFDSSLKAISDQYRGGKTDEFIEPSILTKDKNDLIKDSDTVIFFNFRSDRARQISDAFVKKDFNSFKKMPINVNLLTFVPYGLEIYGQSNIQSIFNPDEILNTFSHHLELNSIPQHHTAETEKFPHVTYFFNGNKLEPEKNETRLLIPSPHVKTYDLAPEMSASGVCQSLIIEMEKRKIPFGVVNFANADMVGHTGNFLAVVKAIEFLDTQLDIVLRTFRKMGYTVVVTADHGNAEQMVNPITGSIDTEHTKNPVPLIIFNHSNNLTLSDGGKLANIAPTLCDLIGIQKDASFENSLILS